MGGGGAHTTEYVGVPPLGATLAAPSHRPKQCVLVRVRFGDTGNRLKKKAVSKVHRFTSVMCSVLFPAHSAKNEEPVPAPLFQL